MTAASSATSERPPRRRSCRSTHRASRTTEWSPTGQHAPGPLREQARADRARRRGAEHAAQPLHRCRSRRGRRTASHLLVGRVSSTMPAGDRFEKFAVWGAPQGDATVATLPNLIGARIFSPDGRYFTGLSRERLDTTRLELYRCGTWSDEEWNVQGDPDARGAARPHRRRRAALPPTGARRRRAVQAVLAHRGRHRRTGRLDHRRGGQRHRDQDRMAGRRRPGRVRGTRRRTRDAATSTRPARS